MPTGQGVFRVARRIHDPLYFDRGLAGRLNAPDGSFGTLYAARERSGAIAETFLRTPGKKLVDLADVRERKMASLTLKRDFRFIELTGPGLARLGATAEVTHCSNAHYRVSQSWSKALHDHPCHADGIAYMARHDDQALSFAIWERCSGDLSVGSTVDDLDVAWFWQIMEGFGVSLAPPP